MGKLTFSDFFLEQWTRLPPPLHADLSNKVVMVTGANTGIGLETAKIFANQHPKKLILGCRSESKGKAALASIIKDTGYHDIELALFDMADFGSVIKFAESFQDEPLDILVANAGILVPEYTVTEDGWESTLQVNHLSTALLSLLLMPNLIHTAQANGTISRMVIVSSDMHYWIKLEEELLDSPSLLQKLSEKAYCTPEVMEQRYSVTKRALCFTTTLLLHTDIENLVLNVLFARGLNEHLPASTPLIVNSVNPGYCYSELRRASSFGVLFRLWLMDITLGRTAEGGARQLIWAALGPDGREGKHIDWLRGTYVSTQGFKEPSDFVISQDGGRAQEKLWEETIQTLTKLYPDLRTSIDQCLTA
ncbi:hypothetical protein EIP86_008102 [Pleurotus ostreatoroseus]|nr:hypothetical protein EIP86_008102 [Pleurotus ostreatoroseus]